MKSIVVGVRFDPKIIKKAKKLKFNFSEFIRLQFEKVTNSKTCPCCGAEIK